MKFKLPSLSWYVVALVISVEITHVWRCNLFLLPGAVVPAGPAWRTPVVCRDCGASFSCKRLLFEHCRAHHSTLYVDFCAPCDKGFKSRAGFNVHKKMFHSSENHYPVCGICGKKFAGPRLFLNHVRTHTDETFMCKGCGKKFKYESTFKRHDKTCKWKNPQNKGVP